MQFSFIILLILSILISIFAIQNHNVVTIDLFFARYQVSQALVILISIVSGALIAGILGTFKRLKKSKEIKDLTKKIRQLEDESAVLNEKLKNEKNENEELEKVNVDLKEELKKNKELLAELKNFSNKSEEKQEQEISSEKEEDVQEETESNDDETEKGE